MAVSRYGGVIGLLMVEDEYDVTNCDSVGISENQEWFEMIEMKIVYSPPAGVVSR